ncbi:hypothetical protein F5884DRAFT_848752 [Xylogone sp. PMI_703]|nr:hypothetical protein F5884DRAFT_848752 [Xylogone sp. PMI_703]
MGQKSVLITGCSDGSIGAALAQGFQKHGFQVFASARKFSKMESLKNKDNIHLLELDVTSESSIKDAVSFIENKTSGRLDCLCNNAGALLMMPLLDTDIQEAKRMFEVNLWGVIAMTQAFAPLIIEAKGTIANTSSISGYLNVPFGSLYGASKSAIITVTETLRLEMEPFGVKVLNVVTGVVASNLGSENTGFQLPPNSRYVDAAEQIRDRAVGGGFGKMSAEEYAERYVSAVEKGTSGTIWIGNNTGGVKWAKFLPSRLVDNLVSKGSGIDRVN